MQRFFVSGYNKSGTTFLQMLLDAHPAVSCPSEHHLLTLLRELDTLSRRYGEVIQTIDERTAGQGPRYEPGRFALELLRQGLLSLMSFGADPATTHSGLNDNSILTNGKAFARLLPEAGFVFIVRDPREVGVSLWHHRNRTEPEFARQAPPLDRFVASVCGTWSEHVRQLTAFLEAHPERATVVRYEDLIGADRDAVLAGLLDFLGVAHAPAERTAMWQATDFDRLKAREAARGGAGAGFYRAAGRDSWRGVLDEAQQAEIAAAAAAELTRFGYPLAAEPTAAEAAAPEQSAARG